MVVPVPPEPGFLLAIALMEVAPDVAGPVRKRKWVEAV
jgi:hypothetical protein